jgi:acyl-CoA synthetase (AMP-forming)/AMP-acid ligase II
VRTANNNETSQKERAIAPKQGKPLQMDRSLGKMLVGNMLATAALRYPDAPAIYCSSTDRRFSFREINDRTNRLARALLGLGFRKGDIVAFLTSNRAEIVEIYFALARTGIIGLPLNYRLAAAAVNADNDQSPAPHSFRRTQQMCNAVRPIKNFFNSLCGAPE